MAKQPNWTAEELNKLKELYPIHGKSKELLVEFPGRTLEGIALKANRVGLKVINNIREKRSNDEYLELIKNTDFIPLEEYKGSTIPIMHMCGVCDHEWVARPQQLLRKGAMCPICSHSNRMNSLNKVDTLLEDAGYTRLSDYKGNMEPLLIKHNKCGYVWETKYSYLQQGSGCPICNIGFGYGYSANKEHLPENALLYIIKVSVDSHSFLKVGITCRKFSTRLREIKCELGRYFKEVILDPMIIFSGSGESILKAERHIIKEYPKYKIDQVFAGSTEIFPEDYLVEFVEFLEKDLNVEGIL